MIRILQAHPFTQIEIIKSCHLRVTLGHVWNYGLAEQQSTASQLWQQQSLLGSLMSGNCLNLSAYVTVPQCWFSQEKRSLKHFSVSSFLIQSTWASGKASKIPCSFWRTFASHDDHWPQIDNDDCLIRSLSLA